MSKSGQVRHVVGFDLSLTAPGAVALPLNWRPGDWKRVSASLLKTKAPADSDDQRGQLERYKQIAEWACDFVAPFTKADPMLFVEAYGFSKNNASASRIMESGGVVRHMIFATLRLLTCNVTASAARKLLLGFNPCRPKHDPKVTVQNFLFNTAGAPKTWDENQCDAFVVANYGLSECGGTALVTG